MIAYLAGPMRNIPLFNFPAFHDAADDLRSRGWTVLSPAEHDEETGFNPAVDTEAEFDLHGAMRWDIESVLKSSAVILLPGWRNSSGAAVELIVADAIGIPTYEYPTLNRIDEIDTLSPMKNVLDEAAGLIYGEREEAYGHPAVDMGRTGRIWGAILGIDDVPARLVALCMVGVKISREVNRPKRDNRVDGAGYWGCVDRIEQYRGE